MVGDVIVEIAPGGDNTVLLNGALRQVGGKARVLLRSPGVEGADHHAVLRAGEAAGEVDKLLLQGLQIHGAVVPDHVAVDAVPGVRVLVGPVQQLPVERLQGKNIWGKRVFGFTGNSGLAGCPMVLSDKSVDPKKISSC